MHARIHWPAALATTARNKCNFGDDISKNAWQANVLPHINTSLPNISWWCHRRNANICQTYHKTSSFVVEMVISFRSIRSVPHQIVNKLSAELLKFKQDVLLICFRLCQIWSFVGLLSGSLITSADDVVAQMVATISDAFIFLTKIEQKLSVTFHHGGWCIFGFISVARHFSEQFLFPCDFFPSHSILIIGELPSWSSFMFQTIPPHTDTRVHHTRRRLIPSSVWLLFGPKPLFTPQNKHTHRGYGHSLNLLRNALRIIWLELRRKAWWNQSREKIG